MIWPAILQQCYGIECAPDIPTCHNIGESIVVDILMVFVWSNDATDMPQTVCLQDSAARPKAGCFKKNFSAGGTQKAFIASRSPILPDGIGHVCADVLLLLSGKNVNNLAIRSNDLFRRRLCTG